MGRGKGEGEWGKLKGGREKMEGEREKGKRGKGKGKREKRKGGREKGEEHVFREPKRSIILKLKKVCAGFKNLSNIPVFSVVD